jgi:hypothetical protein
VLGHKEKTQRWDCVGWFSEATVDETGCGLAGVATAMMGGGGIVDGSNDMNHSLGQCGDGP